MGETTNISREFKKTLGWEVSAASCEESHFPFHSAVVYHGAPILFCFQSMTFLKEFNQWVPQEWRLESAPEGSPKFFFDNPKNYLGTESIDFWEEDPNPDCTILGNKIALQRDFLGIRIANDQFRLICRQEISDGFFNSIRWALPWVLKDTGSWIIHSCGVVKNGFGHLFVGPSGAGKTTTALRSPNDLVLGDDMNCLLMKDSEVFLSSAAVGQNPKFSAPLVDQYPLSGIYFLQQGEAFELSPMNQVTALRKLLSSTPIVDLMHWESQDFQKLWNCLQSAVERVPCFSFTSQLEGDLWKYIFEKRNLSL